jgi:hypothetical protein
MFEKGHELTSRLARQSPENTTLQDDPAWFDRKITTQKLWSIGQSHIQSTSPSAASGVHVESEARMGRKGSAGVTGRR